MHALKIAINMEMAVKDIAEVNPKPRAENQPVHKIQKKYPPSKPNTYDNAKRNEETRPSDGGRTRRFKCLSCGYDNHRREECKFRNATCRSCGLYGHIARVCKSKPVRKVDDRESEVDEQGKYPDVFKTGLGTMQGITAKLELKDGAKPKFCKARPVPYALQPIVEEEYDRLEREVLVHFNPKLPVILETDASQYGVGAVISHRFPNGDERPIAYASRSLNPAEKNYSQIHKEALAIIFGITKFYMYLYGRHFTLYTDHQPLLKIFAPDAATPVLAAARLQRWSLLLSSYRYDIKYRCSKSIANADALSRLPLPYKADSSVESQLYYTIDRQLDNLPVSASAIARETAKDRVLSKVMSLTQHGWFSGPCTDDVLKPYFTRKDELSCEQGCIMWGARVIVPPSLRDRVLEELHNAHPGIAKMKAVARSYVWWPKIDVEIEGKVRNCQSCAKTRNDPPAAPLYPWCWPMKPWQRLHVDFATFSGKHYLIVVDAHSKWPEVIGPMSTTTAESTTNALRSIFSRFGLPEQIVSDNGPPFQSSEYELFLKMNGIQRVLTSPYHQSSNGQAERFVQTFKNFMKAASAAPGNLHRKMHDFLLTYRSSPNATTGVTPAKLLLGREVKTRLSLVLPNLASDVQSKQTKMKEYHDVHAKYREFTPGQTILAKDHRSTQAWQPATVTERRAPYSYSVELPDGRVWNRHVDHLLKGATQTATSAMKDQPTSGTTSLTSFDMG
ncbi:hypothetical protein QZH41_011085, partial [Actinostola sp. cb2023]